MQAAVASAAMCVAPLGKKPFQQKMAEIIYGNYMKTTNRQFKSPIMSGVLQTLVVTLKPGTNCKLSELVENESVILTYMSTERQVADLLTKSLAKIAFERLRDGYQVNRQTRARTPPISLVA
jgi:hypothetical protein